MSEGGMDSAAPFPGTDGQGAADRAFRNLFAACPLALMVLDLDGTVRLWNPAAEQLYGWSAEDVVGRVLPIPEDRQDEFRQHLRMLAAGEALVGKETVRLKRSGPFDAALWTVPVRAADGAVRCLSIVQDVTEQKRNEREREELLEREQRARAAAQEAVRARDEFLSIASHELRTPVTAIRGVAQILQRAHERGKLDEARLVRGLAQLEESSARLAALTDDLLDVSRLQTGHFQLHPERLDLVAFVREIVERNEEALDRRHTLAFSSDVDRCMLEADPARLEQVVENLLTNALKYSPEGGTVTVRLRRPSGSVLVEVTDHGIGLPAGAEDAIFRPFGRAQNAAAQHIQGLGLGLYICRQIVKRHGGRITAHSNGEGLGTTMRVRLPCAGG